MRNGVWRPARAEPDGLAALREHTGGSLPAGYVDQIAVSNAGEGDLPVEPGWISFWPAEEVVASNAGCRIPELLPGFLAFASSGGGELLAFDLRGGEPVAVVMVPFIPMDAREAVRVADSFDDLRALIGKTRDHS